MGQTVFNDRHKMRPAESEFYCLMGDERNYRVFFSNLVAVEQICLWPKTLLYVFFILPRTMGSRIRTHIHGILTTQNLTMLVPVQGYRTTAGEHLELPDQEWWSNK